MQQNWWTGNLYRLAAGDESLFANLCAQINSAALHNGIFHTCLHVVADDAVISGLSRG
jgi:hypothetical protein